MLCSVVTAVLGAVTGTFGAEAAAPRELQAQQRKGVPGTKRWGGRTGRGAHGPARPGHLCDTSRL